MFVQAAREQEKMKDALEGEPSYPVKLPDLEKALVFRLVKWYSSFPEKTQKH